ncbi:MAG: hypothetical protein NC238_13995 [Dehalobacter sp.]|nr:hypothetical protein [Dehalobacter sp.]
MPIPPLNRHKDLQVQIVFLNANMAPLRAHLCRLGSPTTGNPMTEPEWFTDLRDRLLARSALKEAEKAATYGALKRLAPEDLALVEKWCFLATCV